MIVDVGEFQRGGVDDCSVTIGPGQKNRIVRRDFVEISAGWKLGRLPERFNPAAAGYPFVALCLPDALLNLREKIFAGIRPLEIQSHLALADFKNVTMRISETGRNGFARQINDARFVASELFGVRICPTKMIRSLFTAIAWANGCFRYRCRYFR